MDHQGDSSDLKQAKESWEKGPLELELNTVGEREKEFKTVSDIPVKRLYTPLDLSDQGWNYLDKLGFPGQYPFTRGATPTMYRGNIWSMGRVAGYGTAEDTNSYYKYLLSEGATHLPCAIQLASQMGYDSDHLMSRGEVGKQGVPLDSLQDMEDLFRDISLDGILVSTTANAIGPIFFSYMTAMLESRDRYPENLVLSIQNDILKEYTARGTYIFPPKPSVKFSCDLIEYAVRHKLTYLRPICFTGYHVREAGGDVVLELASTLANIAEYVEEVISRGVDIDSFPAVQVLFVSGLDFFEEICKFRAFRRMYARMMKERFHAKTPQAMSFTYLCGSQPSHLTAQQPLNNIARVTITTLVQALGGVQNILSVSYDEALGLPTREAAMIALRTQQIIAYETGVASTVDPLAGSYYVESLTDEIDEKATNLFNKINSMGGSIKAIEEGYFQSEISKSAYEQAKRIWSGEKIVVGVNKFQTEEPTRLEPMKFDPGAEEKQIQKLRKLRKERDNHKVKNSLKNLKEAAKEGMNLVPFVENAVKAYATIGEICDVLREVYGEWGGKTF